MDQIELTLSAENRSRRQIGNKLKELGLISKMEEVTRKPLKSGRGWQEEEELRLRELVEEWKSSENPGARIYEQWKAANMPVRSKKALVEKAVEMELVSKSSSACYSQLFPVAFPPSKFPANQCLAWVADHLDEEAADRGQG